MGSVLKAIPEPSQGANPEIPKNKKPEVLAVFPDCENCVTVLPADKNSYVYVLYQSHYRPTMVNL